jgi:hypothetical protein
MVGKAEAQAALCQLAPLGRPGAGRLDDIEIADEQVVDRVGMGGAGEAETVPQRLEGPGVFAGPQIEIAAEEQRRAPGPSDCCLGRPQDIGRSKIRPVIGRMQVGDAESRGRASECHCPPLRTPLVDRQLPSLHDPLIAVRLFRPIGGKSAPEPGTDQSQVRAALAGGDQVGVAAREEGT